MTDNQLRREHTAPYGASRRPILQRWHLDLAKRAIHGRLPLLYTLRRLKRRLIPNQPDDANMGSTFGDLIRLYELMQSHNVFFHGTVLEIGTGWFPVAAIIARLLGAERIILTDIAPLMDQATFLAAREVVIRRFDNLVEALELKVAATGNLLSNAKTPEQLQLDYLAPFVATSLPDRSLDLVMSRACLEHIPVIGLETLLSELGPKLKPDGIMVHVIDNTDHFSHVDPACSRINFLTWSKAKHERIWRLAKGGENRLRHSEYGDLFRRLGYEVIASKARIHEQALEDARTLPLAPPYDAMPATELAAVTSWYILRFTQ